MFLAKESVTLHLEAVFKSEGKTTFSNNTLNDFVISSLYR